MSLASELVKLIQCKKSQRKSQKPTKQWNHEWPPFQSFVLAQTAADELDRKLLTSSKKFGLSFFKFFFRFSWNTMRESMAANSFTNERLVLKETSALKGLTLETSVSFISHGGNDTKFGTLLVCSKDPSPKILDRYTKVHVKPKSCDRLTSPETIKREKKKTLISTNYTRRWYANYISWQTKKTQEHRMVIYSCLRPWTGEKNTNSEVQFV